LCVIVITISDYVFVGSVIVPSSAGSSSQIWKLQWNQGGV